MKEQEPKPIEPRPQGIIFRADEVRRINREVRVNVRKQIQKTK